MISINQVLFVVMHSMDEHFNITSLFHDAAKKYPANVAIVDGNNRITFSQLQKGVEQTAYMFKKRGIKKGDRVLVFVPMSADLYRIVLALFHIGAIAVFLDQWADRKRLSTCCQLADCKAIIGSFKVLCLAQLLGPLRKIPVKINAQRQSTKREPISEVDPIDTALITFTTGSTGTPKASVRSHLELKAQFKALQDLIHIQPSEVDMPSLPIVLFLNLAMGATSVIPDWNPRKPKRIKTEKLLTQITTEGVTRITASPFFARSIAEAAICPQIRKVYTGGAPVFPNEAKCLKKGFPNALIEIVFGSTEAEPVSSVPVNDLTGSSVDKGLLVGQVRPQTEVRILPLINEDISTDAELEGLTLEDGKIGEIVVAGPHVLKKYFRNDEAIRENKIITKERTWHRMGDSGFIEGNRLWLTGRCGQLIRTHEGFLSPFVWEGRLQLIGLFGTLANVEGTVTIICEGKLSYVKERLREAGITNHPILAIDSIPRDPRHYSKIDYAALLSAIAES